MGDNIKIDVMGIIYEGGRRMKQLVTCPKAGGVSSAEPSDFSTVLLGVLCLSEWGIFHIICTVIEIFLNAPG
jgi:hypothetical protein